MSLASVELDPVVHATIRVAGACLFFAAATPKLRDFAAFRQALSGYALLPAYAAGAAAAVLVAVEIAVGVGLLVSSGGAPVFGAAALLSLYTLAIAINLARGRRSIDCGCGGPSTRRPISGGLVARNIALIAVAAFAMFPVAQRGWFWVDTLTVVACTTTLALLYTAAESAASHGLRVVAGGGR